MAYTRQVSAKALEIAVMILGKTYMDDFQSKDDVDMLMRDYLDLAVAIEPHIRKED